jgi:hypothetical protein
VSLAEAVGLVARIECDCLPAGFRGPVVWEWRIYAVTFMPGVIGAQNIGAKSGAIGQVKVPTLAGLWACADEQPRDA